MQIAFYFFVLLVFLLGAVVGSGLNVCAYRLPYEKSILWPGSRCGHCYQPVRWYDNIPLVSYWLLRGRCRTCGAPFSIRYFLVELFTGLAFVGLFYLEVARNCLDLRLLANQQDFIFLGNIPIQMWCVFAFHAILLSFLIAASLCDLDHMEIPLGLTMTGTVIGLLGSMLFPWPWPDPAGLPMPARASPMAMPALTPGLYTWPVWYPLPRDGWLQPGSWRLGLATGLAGALAGMLLLRAIRFLFGFGRGIEGLGLGDADLMMMAGSFLGWQPVVGALFIGTLLALGVGILQVIRKRGQALPFGPPLSAGVVICMLGWKSIGGPYQPIFFDRVLLSVLGSVGAVFLLLVSFMLRLRGMPRDVGSGPEAGTSDEPRLPVEQPAPSVVGHENPAEPALGDQSVQGQDQRVDTIPSPVQEPKLLP